MLNDTFIKLLIRYKADDRLANDMWLEILTKYSGSNRHYHNVAHLENIITDLTSAKELIADWETIFFAVCYHDVIYNATSSTNEEDSAEIASQRLAAINYPLEKTKKCCEMILATKSHQLATDSDTNFLIDADLAILGKTPDEYKQYAENVRKEFVMYPDFIYKPGRRKVLQHFLDMDSIFKTDHFIDKYEEQARLNIRHELDGNY